MSGGTEGRGEYGPWQHHLLGAVSGRIFGEQGLVPASQSSCVQRDLWLGALHVSLHLSSSVPTRIKQGW